MGDQEWYTTSQISKKLQVTVRTVYRWIEGGALQASKAGKGWRVKDSDLEAFMNARTTSGLSGGEAK